MEYRKIIEFGKSSYVVSLPKPWMVSNKLHKGDTVYVDSDGSKLVIYALKDAENKTPRKITLDVSDMTKHDIRQHLISKYIQNYNEITLTAKNMSSKAKEIRTIVHDLMALEVVEEDSSKIVTKDFINTDDVCPLALVKRMDVITREMISDSKKFFKDDKSETIAERDFDVNRLSYLVFRVLKYVQKNPAVAKKKGFDQNDLLLIWIAATKIEKIADQAKWITKLLRRVKFNNSEKEDFFKLYSTIEKCYLDGMNAVVEKDRDAAFVIISKSKRLIKNCRDFRRQTWNYEWVSELMEKLKTIVGETKALMTYVCDLDE